MFSLATVTWLCSSSAISSSAGAICLQGPHHSAQKSTSTGLPAFRTSFSKDSSVTLTVLIAARLQRFANRPDAADVRACDLSIPAQAGQGFIDDLFWNRHQLWSVGPDQSGLDAPPG